MILIDSNILIYAINADSDKQATAQDFLQRHASSAAVAHQNILEAFRVLTHPKFNVPLPPEAAQEAIDDIVQDFRVITPDETARFLAMRFIVEAKLTGNKIFDAYLAATALSAGISTIATDNGKDFARLHAAINLINPFE